MYYLNQIFRLPIFACNFAIRTFTSYYTYRLAGEWLSKVVVKVNSIYAVVYQGKSDCYH